MEQGSQVGNSQRKNMTLTELRRLVDRAWSEGAFKECARLILSFPVLPGHPAPAEFWLDWARKVSSGKIKPQASDKPEVPLLVNGDLYGEPIVTERRRQ
jgi:hypothetical protein